MSLQPWKWSKQYRAPGYPRPFSPPNPDTLEEQAEILRAFAAHDHAAIRRYSDLVALRDRAQARLACSAAIAGKTRAVAQPDLHAEWLEALSRPDRPFWHNDEPWPWKVTHILAPGTWGPPRGKNHLGWGAPTDADWDGVSRIPKTPGKAARRRIRARQQREEEARMEQRRRLFRAEYEMQVAALQAYRECRDEIVRRASRPAYRAWWEAAASEGERRRRDLDS